MLHEGTGSVGIVRSAKITIVVGAPLAAAPARLSGAAYVFKRKGNVWMQVAKLTPHDGDGGDSFGISVDVSKSRVIVGAHRDENHGNRRVSGSAYIFSEVQTEGTYTQETKLTADEIQEGANFFGSDDGCEQERIEQIAVTYEKLHLYAIDATVSSSVHLRPIQKEGKIPVSFTPF